MNQPVARLLPLPRLTAPVLALALVLWIGWVDYVTGHDLAISAFYILPICWAAGAVGRVGGFIFAFVAAIVWLLADLLSGYPYSHPLIPYWNALMLLSLFLVVVHFLTAFQTGQHILKEEIQRRTAAMQSLQAEIEERKRLEAAKIRSERLAVVGRMAAQMAHEVRNPLGSMSLNLDLTLKEIDKLAGRQGHSPAEGHTLVNEMRKEVSRIGNIIEHYLQFARLPNLQRRPVALNEFLHQKMAFLSPELERANVRLRTSFDPALNAVNISEDQLWQAILNLIRNACEAMPRGGELTIRTRLDGARAVLCVKDNGLGMTEEQRQQVFAPFFTTKKDGTGLGMTLVEQIVAEHGGHVDCESAPGKGSAFTMVLPLDGIS